MRPVESARLRIASKHSDKIRKALVAGINTKKLTEDFLATHKGASITPQQARDWVKVNAVADNKDLTNALRYAYADAWVIGHKSGLSQLGYAYGINKATPSMGDFIQSMSVDWSKWTPGNEAAAALLSPPNGLQTLLNASNTVIQSIDQTSYDRLGTQLASALSQGLTMDDTASLISGVLDDPSRALTIAITESARATTAASRAVYEDSGVEYVTWLVAEGCDDCQENADAGPIPIDATFPTGDAEPPAHPNCMCDLSPYVVDTQGIGGDALDNSFTPDDSGDGSDATTGSLADNIATADGNPYLDVTKVPSKLLHTVENSQVEAGYVLAKEDKQVLVSYTGSSYSNINKYLRTGKYEGKIKLGTGPRGRWIDTGAQLRKEVITPLVKAINNAPALPEDMLTYRGVAGKWADQMMAQDIGTTYTEKGFTSTSLDPKVASNIHGNENNILIEIVNPAGSKGLFTDPQMEGSGWSTLNERELLLAPNTKFQIINKTDNTIRVVVQK